MLLFAAGCAGGQTGTPGGAGERAEPGPGGDCLQAPDASTALGPSTEALWDAYTGSYTVETGRRRLSLDYKLKHTDWIDVTVTVSRSDRFENESTECGLLAAPVEVEMRSADGELDGRGTGAIVWAPDATYCNFSPEASAEDTMPGIGGLLSFEPWFRLLVQTVNGDTLTSYDSDFTRVR